MQQTQTTNTEQPIAVFSHRMTLPGVPLENLISSLALLLGAFGVKHDMPVNPGFTSESLNTPDQNTNERFMASYMEFKLMLEDLSRQYNTVQCMAQSNGNTVYMRFSCY